MASIFKRGGKGAKGYYYVQWHDHTGRRKTKCARTTDKAAAERIARKLESDAALRRDGVIDPELDEVTRESRRSIESHLLDFEQKLRVAARSEQHVRETLRYIREIAEAGEFKDIASITADGVTRFAAQLCDAGRSARTVQAYLTAVKAFTRWLTNHHKLARDPLASIKKPNPKADRRRERRMLLPEEWRMLADVIQAGPIRYRIPGNERLLLYRTAIETGLRSNELRSLTRGRFYLDADPPYIICKARSAKNRKDARQYIQADLAASLKVHLATTTSVAGVFRMPHESNLARMLRDDLAAARKQWLAEAASDAAEFARREQSDFLADTNHEGEQIDFHSLRHTCGAWLAQAGVHPKTVQQVMRHQSITLTMDTYGHLFPGQEAEAVGRLRDLFRGDLPSLRAGNREKETTGTPIQALQLAQQLEFETVRADAGGCEEADDRRTAEPRRNSLKDGSLCFLVRLPARCSESAPFWTRTKNLLIKSQLSLSS